MKPWGMPGSRNDVREPFASRPRKLEASIETYLSPELSGREPNASERKADCLFHKSTLVPYRKESTEQAKSVRKEAL